MRPNLFQFATSELSQDAFLCWLISWAIEDCRAEDKALHQLGVEFITSIFEKAGENAPTAFGSVCIKRQEHNIDILCMINDNTVIVVEDKTGTKQHSDQLAHYKKYTLDKYQNHKHIFIYLQTGDQCDYSEVKRAEYLIYKRTDLLNVLESQIGEAACQKSDILSDFTSNLRHIEDEVQSYNVLQLEEWIKNDYAWKGFYAALQEIIDGRWDYVANRSGGFLGFWWYFKNIDDCQLYLQLEQCKFCFKINVPRQELRRSLFDTWRKRIPEACLLKGLKAKAQSRFKSGTWMTVAFLDEDYLIQNQNGQLDIDKTIGILYSAQSVLDSFCNE